MIDDLIKAIREIEYNHSIKKYRPSAVNILVDFLNLMEHQMKEKTSFGRNELKSLIQEVMLTAILTESERLDKMLEEEVSKNA